MLAAYHGESDNIVGLSVAIWHGDTLYDFIMAKDYSIPAKMVRGVQEWLTFAEAMWAADRGYVQLDLGGGNAGIKHFKTLMGGVERKHTNIVVSGTAYRPAFTVWRTTRTILQRITATKGKSK
jgi:hypothetical protein